MGHPTGAKFEIDMPLSSLLTCTVENGSERRHYPTALLAGLLAAGFLIRVLFAILTPAWEAPDEYPHYWYAEQIAREGTLPRSVHEFPAYEAYQPPLYYLAASVLIGLGDEEVAFSPEPAPPPKTLILVRLFSAVLGVATLWIAYRLFCLLPGCGASDSWRFCRRLSASIHRSIMIRWSYCWRRCVCFSFCENRGLRERRLWVACWPVWRF
jgi:hypothetical protein